MISLAINPSSSYLRDELECQKALFNAQPALVQRFIEAQAQRLADASLENVTEVRFTLPDQVIGKAPQTAQMAPMSIPHELREQVVGGWTKVFQSRDSREQLRQRLSHLEQSPDQAINTSAALLRYATVVHMVYRMLPAGRSITYRAEEGELIPTIPVPLGDGAKGSAITAKTDAVIGEDTPLVSPHFRLNFASNGGTEGGRGDLQVPYAPAARRFYIPQWVALDDDANLLVNSAAEAETHLASMQRYVMILHKALSLATYMAADDEYQRKRYGMLGQLIHQGRALARYRVAEIIRTIKGRVDAGKLNRGLSVSLPYFDDQELKMNTLDFDVIPGGRILFKPVFVLRATRLEQAKVAQDTRLSPSTRKYLLCELKMLEQAF